MFLNWDFRISNRIPWILPPRIRCWKLPFYFCLTLKMLQHSAWCKFLALLSCFLTLKPSSFLKHWSESILKITSDWDRAQKPLLLSCSILFAFRYFFFSRKEHFFCSSLGFTLVSVLSTCQEQLITNSSSDHYKLGPRRKEMLFLYIKIKLSMEFISV